MWNPRWSHDHNLDYCMLRSVNTWIGCEDFFFFCIRKIFECAFVSPLSNPFESASKRRNLFLERKKWYRWTAGWCGKGSKGVSFRENSSPWVSFVEAPLVVQRERIGKKKFPDPHNITRVRMREVRMTRETVGKFFAPAKTMHFWPPVQYSTRVQKPARHSSSKFFSRATVLYWCWRSQPQGNVLT